MAHTDFSPLIHELMARDLSLDAFMRELISAHVSAYPTYDWNPLKQVRLDDVEQLLARWLVPAFTREPPRAKSINAIWCGLFQPIREGETVADMYVAGTKAFEMNEAPARWHLEPEYRPLMRTANSRFLTDLYRYCYEGENRPGNDAENYIALGYAAKTMATLLARVNKELVLGSRKKEVHLAVGWNSGTPLYVGHLDRDGFVPRPLAEALEGFKEEERRGAAHSRRVEEQQRKAVRHFRHADGRRWSIGVSDSRIELRFTDEDGDEHTRTRERYWASEQMPAIAESLVREQMDEGFVEVGAS